LQIALQRAPEALDHRVVPAIAFPAHTQINLVRFQQRLEILTHILTATIRVIQ